MPLNNQIIDTRDPLALMALDQVQYHVTRAQYSDIGGQFFHLDQCPKYPTILAVLLGGSSIYLSYSRLPEGSRHNLNGAIIVETKLAIHQLVNEQRQSLMRMLDIVREECPSLTVPDPASSHWDRFDAVRFAGFDQLNRKRSVKILSLEYFEQSKQLLNVLSSKDKRVYMPLPEKRYYLLQQVSRFPDGLCILHDQWVYTTSRTVCDQGKEAPFAAFGVTADLLLTGFWVHGRDRYGQSIKSRILAYHLLRSQQHITRHIFAMSYCFTHEYLGWLSRELLQLYAMFDTSLDRERCHCSFTGNAFVLTKPVMDLARPNTVSLVQRPCLSSAAVELYNSMDDLSLIKRRPSKVAPNSAGFKITLPAEKSGERGIEIFCKRSQHPQQELERARNAAAIGFHVHEPLIGCTGDLLYPFLGRTESELRLSFYRIGLSMGYWGKDDIEMILHAEMIKAEDMLHAYKKSLKANNICKPKASEHPLHHSFHSQVLHNSKFRKLYGDSLSFGHKTRPMAEFLDTPWKINGVHYPSLGKLFRNAESVLHPTSHQSLSCPLAFGLGVAHGVNVMIASDVSPNGSRDILYTNYEIAGFHPVLLDLATPLYHDVFFRTLSLDDFQVLEKIGENKYEFDEDVISVDFDPLADDMTQAVFDIKQKFLLQPLFSFAFSIGLDLEKNMPLLSSALLLCATLTQNHNNFFPDPFFCNMATGIILSQATDLASFYACLAKLGIKT